MIKYFLPQPFDFLMKKFHQLYFTKVDIPDDLKEGIQVNPCALGLKKLIFEGNFFRRSRLFLPMGSSAASTS